MLKLIPYRTARSLRTRDNARNILNPFADDFFRGFWNEEPSMGAMKVDVRDKGDHFLLEAELPGFRREEIGLTVDEGMLTIRAEAGESKEEQDPRYLFRERRRAAMVRSFCLEGIEEAQIDAKYDNGVLTLVLPKQNEVPVETRRSIEIR